jgi:hypothetical protein
MKVLDEVQFPVVYDRRESKAKTGDTDGAVPKYRAGDVLKRKAVVNRPFCDYIIIGFDKDDNARLVRPFAMAVGPGVANPATAVSYETLGPVALPVLDEYYEVVGTGFYMERKS